MSDVNEFDTGEDIDLSILNIQDANIISYNICKLWTTEKTKLPGIYLDEGQEYRRLGSFKVYKDGFSLGKKDQTVGKSLVKSKRIIQFIFNKENSQLLNLRMFDGDRQILRLIGKDNTISLDYLEL